MKITAIIADDRRPDGWPEIYTAATWNADEAAARTQMEKVVNLFNGDLRPHELPRRLISVHLEELELEDAWNLGLEAFHAGRPIEANYWTQGYGPLHDEWRGGWECGQAEDEGFNDE